MAEQDDELDLDTAGQKSGGGLKMIIIMVVIALLVSASIIGTLYFTGSLAGGAASSEDSEDDGETAEQVEVKKPAIYIDLGPSFTVNFPDNAVAEYLQIEMQAMARDKQVETIVTTHMPVIRNDILLLLSAQQYTELKTREGKQRLQKAVLQKVREVVRQAMLEKKDIEKAEKAETVDVPNVENVYFTSFIMQ